MLDKEQVKKQLESFGDKLSGDEYLFALVDLRLPASEQLPKIVVGRQAAGLIQDGHYHAEYVGENSTSKRALRDRRIEKTRAENPDFKAPKTILEQLEELKAENQKLSEQLGTRGPGRKAKEIIPDEKENP